MKQIAMKARLVFDDGTVYTGTVLSGGRMVSRKKNVIILNFEMNITDERGVQHDRT